MSAPLSSGRRILTLQQRSRELGRLRSGYSQPNTDPAKRSRPARSSTWIVTTQAEHLARQAAELWGGEVERWQPQGAGVEQWRVFTAAPSIMGVLAPGDPLSQTYELWSGGGCQRRCDGEIEQISGGGCLCREDYGSDWHTQPKGRVCAITSRLSLILPEVEDIGVWRVETHSYNAAVELAAGVDLIRYAVGSQAFVPVSVRIDQRSKVSEGQTKQFPVVVVELRGWTAGQLLGAAGAVPALGDQQVALGQPAAEPVALAPGSAANPVGRGREETPRAIEAPVTEQPSNWAAEAEPGPPPPSSTARAPKPAQRPDVPLALQFAQLADSATTEPELRAIWAQAVEAKANNAALRKHLSGLADDIRAGRGPAERAKLAAAMAPPVPSQDVPLPTVDDLWVRIMQEVPMSWTTTEVETDYQRRTGETSNTATVAGAEMYLEYLRTAPRPVQLTGAPS